MLGVPTSIQLDDQVDASLYNHYVGTFAQDSWRVTRNLTLNAGLRFEYEDGIREKDDRMLVGFDPDALTSISQAAEAAYLASGVANTPGMLPSISVRGGSVFATDPGQDRASWKGQAMWMPRVSAAYKLGERMVLKGGWGLYYDTLNAGDVRMERLSPTRPATASPRTPETAQIWGARFCSTSTRARAILSLCVQMAAGSTRQSVPRSAPTQFSEPRSRIRI